MTEEQIFLAAVDLPDQASRTAYLDEVCGQNSELRRQVEELLAAHLRSGQFLDEPAAEQMAAQSPIVQTVALNDHAMADKKKTSSSPSDDGDDDDLQFLSPSTRPDSLGRLGHYEVLQVLGRGGFGIVFRAFDEMLQRVVALKVMTPQLAATSPARKRFLREARSSAQVRHENVVQVYEVAEQPLPYLAMEFIPGETLQQKLDRVGPLDALETLRIGRQIAEGLAAAHATDLIHRDIKPGNVLLEGGQHKVKITDFGLARAADDASISQSGIIAGTPMYMAPEQAKGDKLDQRADLFSLGSVLYQMVSGRPPFRANSTVAVLKRVADDTPRPIREIIPETPQWLCDIIAKLHAKDPNDRYQSAREVADVLADCEAQLKAHAKLKDYSRIPRSKPQASGPRPRSRSRRWAAAAAVLLLLLGSLGITEATGVTDVRGTVIRLFSPEGTLVVEVDDPGVSVKIDDSDIVITGAGAKEIRLKPGRYTVEARKDGKLVSRELVTVTKNGKQVVRVSQEPVTVPKTAAEKQDPDRRAAEYVLSIGGMVRVDGNDRDIRAKTDLPMRTFRLTLVGLNHNKQVTDSGLAAFQGCKNLSHLWLFATSITDAGLAAFKDCMDLTDLMLARTSITGEGLAHFRDCKNLNDLDLSGTPIGDEGLAHLKRHQKLTILRIGDMPVTDAGLAHLAGLKQLTILVLDRTKVTDAGLGYFKDCKDLSDLSLEGTPITDEGLAQLKGHKKLAILTLRDTPVTDPGLAHLAGLKGLTFLFLRGAKVSDRGLAHLKGMPLKRLGIDNIGITDLTPLQGMPLEEIYLTPKNIAKGLDILRDMKSLKTIGIDTGQWPAAEFWERYEKGEFGKAAAPFTDADVQHIAALPAAEQVEEVRKQLKRRNPGFDGKMETKIEGGVVTEFSIVTGKVTDIAPIRVFNALRVLYCSDGLLGDLTPLGGMNLASLTQLHLNNTKVTDAGLAHFKDCKNLTILSLAVPTVSDVGLVHFEECKKLSHLNLDGTKVSDAGLANFKGMPLRLLLISNTSITDLTPVQGMPLEDIRLTPKNITRGLDILRNMKGLRTIGIDYKQAWAAAEFWQRYDKGEFGKAGDTSDPDRRAAEYVLSIGGLVRVDGNDREIRAKGKLPTGAFQVTHVTLFQNKQVTDAGLAAFKDCKNVTWLDLYGCNQITEAGLAHFKDCKNLWLLNLEGTQVSDAGLAHFKDCKNLTNLYLTGTSITDEGLAHLNGHKNLAGLYLQYTQVKDAGLAHLAELNKLTELKLSGTKVSAAGIEALKKALPKCKIQWDGGVIEPSASVDPDRRAAQKDIDEVARLVQGADWQAMLTVIVKLERELAPGSQTADTVAGMLLERQAEFVAEAAVRALLEQAAKKDGHIEAAHLVLQIAQARQTVRRLKHGHVIVGQVRIDDGKFDPELVLAQMPISPRGYFAGEVGDLKRPVGFRAPGYEPFDLTLEGKQGHVIAVGEVKLKTLPKNRTASLKAKITLDGAKTAESAEVSLSMIVDPASINTPHNGYAPRRRWLEKVKVPVAANGEITARDLTPGIYLLSIKAKDHVDHGQVIDVRAAAALDLKTVRLACTDLGVYIGKAAPRTDPLKWEKDYTTALARAQAEKRPLLVMMTATWCGPCKMLEQDTLSDPWVRHFLSEFVVVKAYEDKQVEKKYGMNGYPTLVFAESSGKEASRTVGYQQTLPFAAQCAEAYRRLGRPLPVELQMLLDRQVLPR